MCYFTTKKEPQIIVSWYIGTLKDIMIVGLVYSIHQG